MGPEVIKHYLDHPSLSLQQVDYGLWNFEIKLLCRMESEYANKIVVELIHEDFEKIRDLLNILRRTGWERLGENESWAINWEEALMNLRLETDIWGGEVLVWLI